MQLCRPEDTLVAALVAGGGEHDHVVRAGRADGGKDGAESLVELREAEGEVDDIDAVVVVRREVLDGLSGRLALLTSLRSMRLVDEGWVLPRQSP